jgi:hypothetical protein
MGGCVVHSQQSGHEAIEDHEFRGKACERQRCRFVKRRRVVVSKRRVVVSH